MSATKKVMDVVSPSDSLPTVQIETRKRVVIDDVQDKNLMSPQTEQGTASGPAEQARDQEPPDVVDPTSEQPTSPAVSSDSVLVSENVIEPPSPVESHEQAADTEVTASPPETSQDSAALPDAEQPETVVVEPASETDLPDETADAEQSPSQSAQDEKEETLAVRPQVASADTPTVGQSLTSQLQATMDHPQAFDTTEYFVPIGQTKHRHKLIVESLVFGVMLTVLVLVAIVVVFS